MEKETFRRMLELTYELEGLLEMAVNREDVPEMIHSLIRGKIDSIESLARQDNVSFTMESGLPEPPGEEQVEEDDPEDALPEDALPEEESAEEESAEKSAGPKKIKIFSINDRFLYSRELFGGSIAEFEKALMDVAGFESYEEAEEYFYGEYGFDAENPHVADFMTRIAEYFES